MVIKRFCEKLFSPKGKRHKDDRNSKFQNLPKILTFRFLSLENHAIASY